MTAWSNLSRVSPAIDKFPSGHLYVGTENELALNLVDAPDPKYFRDDVINAGLDFITRNIGTNEVLVHCNAGMSRSPGIAFLWMFQKGMFNSYSFNESFDIFTLLYPNARLMGAGMLGYLRARCARTSIRY